MESYFFCLDQVHEWIIKVHFVIIIHNEINLIDHIIEHVISSFCYLNYRKDRLQVQVHFCTVYTYLY